MAKNLINHALRLPHVHASKQHIVVQNMAEIVHNLLLFVTLR
jgi:hypothetical protein